MVGLAVAGAAGSAAWYARQPRDYDETLEKDEVQTPGEASVEAPEAGGVRIADTLRGIWDLRLSLIHI